MTPLCSPVESPMGDMVVGQGSLISTRPGRVRYTKNSIDSGSFLCCGRVCRGSVVDGGLPSSL